MAAEVLNSTAVLQLNFCAKPNICASVSATSPSRKPLPASVPKLWQQGRLGKIIINETDIDVSDDLQITYNHFQQKTDTIFVYESVTELFLKSFAMIYLKDINDFYASDKITRSNWTHLTANTFFKTCQQLQFLGDFEVEKRHDGAVRDAKGNVYICAEWEFDTNSIFKTGGEIEKLFQTCKKHNNCDAFLFSYKINDNFVEYADKIHEKWKNMHQNNENFKLYVLTAIFEKDEIDSIKYLKSLRLLGFSKESVEIWEDYE